MKRMFISCLFVVALCLPAGAQRYSVDWYKIAGGGGTSTGGICELSGTIGQHDAGGPIAQDLLSRPTLRPAR